MKKLYRFEWDWGRMGCIQGTFVAEEKDVTQAIGRHIYFGEVLGKHSEVEGELDESDFGVLTDDQDFIEKFEELVGSTGYNPLDYLNEE
jgi:hypothetical protein